MAKSRKQSGRKKAAPTARAAEGKALRRQREAARRYAVHLEKLGYMESARRLRETSALISAGRGRSYSDEARQAAAQVKADVARQKNALASLARFNREAASARRGYQSPLTQGMGFTDLRQFPNRTVQRDVSHVNRRTGRVTHRTVTEETRALAAKKRFQLMESYFYRFYQSQGLEAGPGHVQGWLNAEGLYPGPEDRLGSIVMGTGAESAIAAWQSFWAGVPDEVKKTIDDIAVQLAQNGRIDEETLDMAGDEGLVTDSPTGQELQQAYGNGRR